MKQKASPFVIPMLMKVRWHGYAALRLSKGDTLAGVSKEMGHSGAEITYRTYYKWLPNESNSDIDELDCNHPQPARKRGT